MQAILETFRDLRPGYQLLAQYLLAHMRLLTDRLELYPILMGRAKSLESFAEKIGRKGKHYEDPLVEMTDLCGVRVIIHLLKEAKALADVVSAEASAASPVYSIDQDNSENKAARLDIKSFGYLSDHYILVVERFPPIEGFDDGNRLQKLAELRDKLVARGGKLCAELQIRTLAQHAWADIYHELGYKNEFQLPRRWERDFARLAALLEQCDKGFQEISDAMMGTYDPSYSAFLDENALASLAESLRTILQVISPNDKGYSKTAHRLLKTYIALGDKAALDELLRKNRDLLTAHPPALRDMGVALCQIHKPGSPDFRVGQTLLEQAVKCNPNDVDARCSLAGSLRKEDSPARRAQARSHYRDAYRLEPSNPYPLANYIAEEIQHQGDARILEYFHASIEDAMQRCAKQIEVQINLPWAYFDLGIFELYLQRPGYLALRHYARGIRSATHDWMVRSAFKTVDAMRQRGVALNGLDLSARLLNLGWWTKASARARCPVDLAFPPRSPFTRLEAADLTTPALIVAGHGDSLAPQHAASLSALRSALSGFEGALISGGTRSGLPGLVGHIACEAGGKIRAIGYLPHGQRALEDHRYHRLRYTEATDFSPLEPLSFHEDWIASGRSPTELKLIGFNGGQIAAVEYRAAVALGLTVGIVANSGREADLLLQDPYWQDLPNLSALKTEDEIRSFLRRSQSDQ